LGLTQTLPDEGGRLDMRLGRIVLQEQGDGTVGVIYPGTMPMAVAMTPEKGAAMTAVLTLRHEGLGVTVSGTPKHLRYDYSGTGVTIDLGQVTIDGKRLDTVQGTLRLGSLSGSSEGFAENGARLFTQTISAGPVGYSFAFDDPEADMAVDYEGTTGRLDYDGRLRLPEGEGLEDMATAIRAGARIANRITFGPGESRFSTTEDGVTAHATSRSAGSGIEMTISDEGLELGFRSDDLVARVEGGGLPFALAYKAERAAGSLLMPVVRGEDVQDFALSLDLAKLALSEDIWAMVDPGATLPRDPANLSLDLSGRGKLGVDLFDETAMAALATGDSSAFAPERLVLDTLLLELAGARLVGTGAVDIEPDAAADIPPARGAVDLRLEGGNALLDRLVAMGVLPQDQATTVRMMAAMFTEAVAGEDTLTSRIEIEKDGTITVNDQRMR
jgi:hypothetical protein